MFPSDFLIFLQIILFLFITPGLPRVVIVSHTLNYGLNRSVWTALGDISANIIQGILVVFIIGSLLSDNPQVLNYLKWAGILYIVYLAYDTYTAKISSINSKSQSAKSTFSFSYFLVNEKKNQRDTKRKKTIGNIKTNQSIKSISYP